MKRYVGQGVAQVVRFNWPMYVAAAVAILAGLYLGSLLPSPWSMASRVLSIAVLIAVLLSLLATFYAYDLTDLYELDWLRNEMLPSGKSLVNIHAGFDEMSAMVAEMIPGRELLVFDFYDPRKHTEPSIERARRMSLPFPGTKPITTRHIPVGDGMASAVFLFFAAHEIRDEEERMAFLREVRRILCDGGRVYVMEHLRDLPNVIAYHAGVFHFHARGTWLRDFKDAGLALQDERRLNAFMTLFKLTAYGDAD